MLDKNNYIIRNAIDLPTKKTPCDGLFASKSLLLLKKKWFTKNEFSASTSISNIKYNYLRLKHQNSFYPFNNQLDYTLAHYFAESDSTKSNINKFLFDPLMIPLTKKLSYKNADGWIKKLLEILENILIIM